MLEAFKYLEGMKIGSPAIKIRLRNMLTKVKTF